MHVYMTAHVPALVQALQYYVVGSCWFYVPKPFINMKTETYEIFYLHIPKINVKQIVENSAKRCNPHKTNKK